MINLFGVYLFQDEDAFDVLPPPVVPVVVQHTFQPPKRKQSILMMGKDRKKMADEASANLQKLGLSGEGTEDVLNSFINVEDKKDYIPPPTGAERRRTSLAQSNSVASEQDVDVHSETNTEPGRRKSFLNSGLNLGLDLEVPEEPSAVLEDVVEEEDEEECKEYNETAEQWEGGEQYDQEGSVYDQSQTQSQYYEEGENENDK